MKSHWHPALIALASLPAAAYANSPTTKPYEPMAREYFKVEAEPEAAEALRDPDPLDFDVYWKNGLVFRTNDKRFKLKIGGRIHYDWAFFSEDLEAANAAQFPFENGSEFRRTRLYFEGTIYDRILYKTQFDFSSDATGADFKDVWIGYKIDDRHKVQVGQFKEPFSINELTSSNSIAFMERGLHTNLLAAFSNGVMFSGTCEDDVVHYAAGVFKDENDVGFATGSGEYAFTGRITSPIVNEEDTVVHVGIAASLRDLSGMMFDLDARPSAHLAPSVLQNSAFAADEATVCGAELALITGPFWAYGEYIMTDVDALDTLPDADVNAYSFQAGYFLTGEQRGYKAGSGKFGGIKPKREFGGEEKGCGAWEVAVRYAMLEFENLRAFGSVFNDELSDITVGVNWYWNPNVRMMFNYVNFDLDSRSFNAGAGLDEGGSAFMTRFQVAL